MLTAFIPILLFIAKCINSFGDYGCYTDGCNPQRTFTLGAAFVPYADKQSLRLNWTYSAANLSANNPSNINKEYLGWYVLLHTSSSNIISLYSSANAELNNTISCLFINKGLYTLDQNGHLLWSYSDPIISSQIANISSVPLQIGIATVINTGTQITTFEDGIFKWQQMVSNLSNPTNTISKYSVGFVEPSYFSIQLGDERFSLYDFSQGMCWTAINLVHENHPYNIASVTSSIDDFIYVIGINANGTQKCAIFAFQIGDVTYRLQTRWVYAYECNEGVAALGMSVIAYNVSSTYPVATIIAYNGKNELFAIRDESEYKVRDLWQFGVDCFCGMGYLIDVREIEYGTNGVWICDVGHNETLFMKHVNMSNGVMIESINVNEIIFDAFGKEKNVKKVNITSRGMSGATESMKHFVIVLCVDVQYEDDEEDVKNMLIVIDVVDKYLLSWFIFDDTTKCVGQLSVTNDQRLIVPVNDGVSVIALS